MLAGHIGGATAALEGRGRVRSGGALGWRGSTEQMGGRTATPIQRRTALRKGIPGGTRALLWGGWPQKGGWGGREVLELGGAPLPPLQGAQPMPHHCPPHAKCQCQWRL